MRFVLAIAFSAQILFVQVCSATAFLPLPESDVMQSRASAGEFVCRALSGSPHRSLQAHGSPHCPTDHCFENHDHEENLDIALADGTRFPAENPSNGREELAVHSVSTLHSLARHGTTLATVLHWQTIVLNL